MTPLPPHDRIARLEALLERMRARAAEPRARRWIEILASAYDDIQDEAEDQDDVMHVSLTPGTYGSSGWTVPPVPASVPPPVSPPIFSPPPVPVPVPVSSSIPAFAGEAGTLVSRQRPPSAMIELIELIELALDPPHTRPAAGSDLEVELREDPPEITDVFVSPSRFAAEYPWAGSDPLELEILGEAEPAGTAPDLGSAVDDAPSSSPRPITQPPESGPQLASVSIAPMPVGVTLAPSSMEAVLPIAQSPGEYRPDARAEAARTAAIIRPRFAMDVQVADAIGAAPEFLPETFGELLAATLDL